MAGGPLVAAAAQSTTTTTGTGAITISNTVPAGAPAGSTTFAAAFAPTAVFPVANIFYVIKDAQSPNNYEAGYGTLTSATVLTRDFVIFSGVANTAANPIPQFVQNPTASFLALAAGTAARPARVARAKGVSGWCSAWLPVASFRAENRSPPQ